VAVKLIKAGMDSRQVMARFEAGRQALVLMDHPYIARVLDPERRRGLLPAPMKCTTPAVSLAARPGLAPA
jgi:hypothetical protein